MKLPIIIDANGDVYLYDSLDAAERDIEPPDVLNGIYTIYDSEGMVLRAIVQTDSKYDAVKIVATDEIQRLDLERTLSEFLKEIDAVEEFGETPLSELIAKLRMYSEN